MLVGGDVSGTAVSPEDLLGVSTSGVYLAACPSEFSGWLLCMFHGGDAK